MNNGTKLAVTLALLMPLAILSGWAISSLWGWFIVPVFGGPLITWKQAIGVGLLFGYLSSGQYHDTSSTKWGEQMVYAVVRPVMAVGLGWIFKTIFL